jgi:hypothetical protein
MGEEAVATPPSDFDGAWKYALEQHFPAFLALFFPVAHTGIDWQQPVVVRDTELQQLAPEDQAGKQRVDWLVEVRRRDGTSALVLVHIEVQSQRDVAFAARMFRYHARLYDTTRLPVVSLAILGDESADWRPDQFGYALWGCELLLRFPTVKLRELDTAALEASTNPFATLTLLHRDAQETRGKPEERLKRKVARFRALLGQGLIPEDVRILLRLIEHLLRFGSELAETARLAMRQVEVEERGMDTFVTSFEEIAQRNLVLRLLDRKVGPLPEALRAQVKVLTYEALLNLSDALLNFTRLDELMGWLAGAETVSDDEEIGTETFVTSFEEISAIMERRTLVLRLLDRKVGPLPEALRVRVAALTPAALLDLSDALLDFTSLDELVNWLARAEAASGEARES